MWRPRPALKGAELSGEGVRRLGAQGKSFVHVGMDMAKENDFCATFHQADFTDNLKFLPVSPKLPAGRRDSLPLDATKMPRRKLGGLC